MEEYTVAYVVTYLPYSLRRLSAYWRMRASSAAPTAGRCPKPEAEAGFAYVNFWTTLESDIEKAMWIAVVCCPKVDVSNPNMEDIEELDKQVRTYRCRRFS